MSALSNYIEENNYELLSKFESVQEFNNHFEQAMLFHKDKFTKSEYIALNKLRKYAYSENNTNTVGVAWSRIQKVVAATHKESIFGISRSTFDRMLRKAKRLNLLRVINQYREDKYQKHNVYVFNRFEELTPENFEVVGIVCETQTIGVPENAKIDAPITILLELPVLKDLYTYPPTENVPVREIDVIDFEETKTEYEQMSDMIEGLFTDKRITYRLYGVWLAKIKHMFNKPSFQLAISAIRVLIGEIKRRTAKELKPLKNSVGYFNGILSNMIKQWSENELQRNCDADDWEHAMRTFGDLKTRKLDEKLNNAI